MTAIEVEALRRHTGRDGFAAIDLVFADFLLRQCGGAAAPELAAAALFVARAVRAGHSCCDLALLAGTHFPAATAADGGAPVPLPELAPWLAALTRIEHAAVLGLYPGPLDTPLLLDGSRLYLQRYLSYELTVAAEIDRRCRRPGTLPELPPGRLAQLLDYFAQRAGDAAIDHQQLAVFAAHALHFGIITGGPGTGKTTVVAALLALELERDAHLQIALCAPTGKAQARLKESLLSGVRRLHIPPAIARRLEELPCATLHALLQTIPGTTNFRHHRDNPLPFDLVVVDESSMVSLALMAKLLPAVKPEGRILLLGDRNQLASVEAGAVLADLCDCGEPNHFPADLCAAFAAQTRWHAPVCRRELPLSGHIAELTASHRFATAPTIGMAADAMRGMTDADAATLAARLSQCQEPDFRTRRIGDAQWEAALRDWLRQPAPGETSCYADLPKLARRGDAAALCQAFELLHRYQILCAVRAGRRGVLQCNETIRRLLRMRGEYAPGVPLMVVRNDARTGLFNGDIGLVWRDLEPGAAADAVRVYFPDRPRGFRPAELPEHEAVFAMTVHKSQGSGFTHLLLMLPEEETPVLTRELLYTGITRAERSVELWADAAIITRALARRTIRQSGLPDRLAARRNEAKSFETD